jgi:hypothetical protein
MCDQLQIFEEPSYLQGASADNFTIPVVCNLMNNNARSHIARLADVNNLVLWLFNSTCTASNYTDFIRCMRETSFDSDCADCELVLENHWFMNFSAK